MLMGWIASSLMLLATTSKDPSSIRVTAMISSVFIGVHLWFHPRPLSAFADFDVKIFHLILARGLHLVCSNAFRR